MKLEDILDDFWWDTDDIESRVRVLNELIQLTQ